MNKYCIIFALIVWAILVFPSQTRARIMENMEECTKRYGKPIKIDKKENSAIFKKNEFIITTYFFADSSLVNNKVGCISFIKIGNSLSDTFGQLLSLPGEEMSDTEIQTLLEANSYGGTFNREDSGFDLTKKWKTMSIGAIYDTFTHRLTIATSRYVGIYEKKKELNEKKKLKDF